MTVSDSKAQIDSNALQRTQQLFWQQIESGLHPGASLAVYYQGRLVLDLSGGTADTKSGQPVASDTHFILFSAAKPLTAACLHILWERGKFQWDEPVAAYWPEFAQNGKEGVTIRHVLTHQGGFPQTPGELTPDKWQDWAGVIRVIERMEPSYAPGQVIAYHPRNYGWVVGELVRRIDGRPINQFFLEEITRPLGMNDTYMGLPQGMGMHHRVSRLHAMEDCDRPAMVHTYNKPQVHHAVQPAGGVISTARDLARFYAMLQAGGSLEGAQILQPETVAEVTRLHVEGIDHTSGQYVYRSLGMTLGDLRMGQSFTDPLRTFGHGGAGTSIGWADYDSGLAVAYITNGFRANVTNIPRLATLSQAVREAFQ